MPSFQDPMAWWREVESLISSPVLLHDDFIGLHALGAHVFGPFESGNWLGCQITITIVR